MKKEKNEEKILKVLLKQFSYSWTITSLSNEINISRVGLWKILKKLKREKIIVLSSVGEGKTNVLNIKLNWENLIIEKKLSLLLTEETLNYQRWMSNFNELKNLTDFLILYGSILHSPNKANDIDLIGVVHIS